MQDRKPGANCAVATWQPPSGLVAYFKFPQQSDDQKNKLQTT
jgi:hypothetical protein